MRYGMNLLLWTDTLTDEALPLLDEIKQIGFDAVELPVFEADVEKYAKWGKQLDNAGPGADRRDRPRRRRQPDEPRPEGPPQGRRGQQGRAGLLPGGRRRGAGRAVSTPPWATSAAPGPPTTNGNGPSRACEQVAEHAEKCGVTLALEYLNRFECYLLNTAADGARFCREVNHPRCKMMYDTFHSHIEEKNTPAAIRALKGCLAHVHISENDRSTPGPGNVRWAETFDTLHEIGYDNLMVIEAFGLALERLLPATKIWRRMYESERQLAADGLKFMKAEVAKRW